MTDTPTIKVTGQGSRREAARLGQTIGEGVANALADHAEPIHIDTLRVQVSAGAGKRDIECAIRIAIVRRKQGGRQ